MEEQIVNSPPRLINASRRRVIHRIANLLWIWAISLTLCVIAFVLALSHALDIGKTESIPWLFFWMFLVAVLATARVIYRVIRGKSISAQKFDESFPPILRGFQSLIAAQVAALYVLILVLFKMPSYLLYIAAIIFVPGMMILALHLSRHEEAGKFPRPVTVRALIYILFSVIVLIGASLALTGGEIFEGGQMPLSEVADLAVILAKIIAPATMAFVLLASIYALQRDSDLSRLQGDLLTTNFVIDSR